MTYRLTQIAELDLVEIHEFIAKGSQNYAHKTLDLFRNVFRLLAEMPNSGTLRQELANGLRSYPTGNYIIFYHVDESFVIIDRILHSARDIDSLFNSN